MHRTTLATHGGPAAPSFAALLLAVALLVPHAAGADSGVVRSVGPDAFAKAMDAPGAFVIQTHVPYEGEIDGTDLIAHDWRNVASYELPSDRDTPMLVYCGSGYMSAIAARELEALGYTRIVDLAGGMNAWRASGRQLVTRGR